MRVDEIGRHLLFEEHWVIQDRLEERNVRVDSSYTELEQSTSQLFRGLGELQSMCCYLRNRFEIVPQVEMIFALSSNVLYLVGEILTLISKES